MKKNYFNFRKQFAKKLAGLTCRTVLLLFFFIGTATAQVTITKPSLSLSTCTGFPTSYSTLSNIVITETGSSNFSTGTNVTLVLSAPTNFEYKASTGTVSYTAAKNITAATIVVTTSTITITYSVSGTTKTDAMTISGIQLRGITTASSGDITRTGGTGVISGCVTTTTMTSTISSTSVSAPSQATGFTAVSTTSTTFNGSYTTTAIGSLVIRSTSSTPPTQPIDGTVYSAANIATLGPGLTFIQSSAATSITDTGLSGNTKYYYFIYSYNSCSGSYLYNTAGALTGTITTCSAVPNTVASSAVTPTGFNLSWAYPTGGTANAITYTVTVTTDAGFTTNVPGSPFSVADPTTTLTLSGLSNNTIYYYRILASNGCSSAYVTGTVTTLLPYCTAPTAQATGLTIGTLSSNAIAATFTAAVADGYLIIYSTSATAPSQPVNGVTYTAANIATLGTGLTFIQSSSATTTAGAGLIGNTKYYIFIYGYNGGATCSGPIYSTLTPLKGNATTCADVPTSVVTSGLTASAFNLDWTAPAGGSASAITYTVQITTDAAFTADITDSPFTVVDPVTTLSLEDLEGNQIYYYRILASNGCNSNYVTGSITTLTAPCEAPIQAFNFTNGAITSSTFPATFLGSADGFLVVRSTSATPPTQPVDGNLYTAANVGTLGTGLTFMQSGSSNNIASTGLTGNTNYYYYVFAYTNSIHCTGGPVYNVDGPLVGSGITCPSAPTAITSSGISMSGFTLNWTAPAGGAAAAITYTVQITTNPAYTVNIPGSPFTIADPTTTIAVTGLTYGTTYYYRISANNGCPSAYTTGFVTTSITNDNCATAIALPVNSTSTCLSSTNGTTYGATQSQAGCSGIADDDVWYKFTATATSHTVTVTPISINDIVFQVFNNSCTGTNLGCVDGTNSYSTETNTFTGLTIGNVYYVRIYSFSSAVTSEGNFNICVTTPIAPINNDCSGALVLAVNSTTTCVSSTNGTSLNATQSQVGCAGTADDDVWYKFTATAASHKVTVTPNTMSNVVFQVFSGTCAGLTSMQCVNATSGSSIESTTLAGLTVGSTYYVRVYSSGSGSGSGSFSICVTTSCSAGTGNGTGTTSCPNIVAGAAGMSGAAPSTIPCYATNKCTNLEAIYPEYNETTSYSVSEIPYAPPYQYTCLANPLSVNVDDVWSNTITLPFNFCFYGNNYNKVLIGSNGAITFDTTTYSPGGYSNWSITNNLPNSSLFLNSIFGVYHDIDPSKGGQVGWELITLSSGCRALVAAWSDIPMYSTVCNNSLYTGMMVMYENSNIIDVYIKEKNACSSWNGGNAVIGIQNANATQAVVAPNRNSLDADWTVNEEAWRFTPSGASVSSVKWYEGSGTAGTVVGTTANVSVCPTATTTYTAEVTYSFCNGVTSKLTSETTVSISTGKTWTGAIDTDWNTAGNWSPAGVPTNVDCITIPSATNEPVISGLGYNAYCYNLTVSYGSSLEATSRNNIIVNDFVKVKSGAIFNLRDSASLIQINNTAVNSGNINMDRTAYVKAYDYVYWCSPVKTFSSSHISPTSPAGYIFKWNPTITNGNGGQGTWVAGTENMALAKGYIVLAPGSLSSTVPSGLTSTFTGIPNNGIKKPLLSRGGYTGADFTGANGTTITNMDDNWNLIGNPFPSAINALSFLTLNTNINGNVRLWTHGSPISNSNANPFYGTFIANYNSNDYITYNGTGSTPPGFNGKIGAGQGFFVLMNDGAAGSAYVTFNNSMRSAAYDNSQFYKQNSSNATTAAETEKHRIWLSLIDANHHEANTLVGYVADATYGEDRLYDAYHKASAALGLYSMIENKPVIINGRPTPFDNTDFVHLGASIPTDGTYTIGINQVDGLFTDSSQNIYLEDTELQIIHDLRVAPYSFVASAGNYTNRFILRYINTTLGTVTQETASTYAYISNHILNIKSDDTIKEIYLYEMSGKLISKVKPSVEANHFEMEFPYQNGVYLATILKANGQKTAVKLLN
jgi:phosphodiesterase/alkaline phosphatase D-like protein